MYEEFEALFRVVIAMALGAVLGWERQATGKQAGLRTHMLVALGAALFVALGEAMVVRFDTTDTTVRLDPMRIVEAVVTGVSFLGAGTIFVSRGKRERVRGLTTAASIWATAGVGLAAGLGRYVLAVGTTAAVLLILKGLIHVEPDEDVVNDADARAD